MKIVIECTEKEIADLVRQLQGQQEINIENVAKELSHRLKVCNKELK